MEQDLAKPIKGSKEWMVMAQRSLDRFLAEARAFPMGGIEDVVFCELPPDENGRRVIYVADKKYLDEDY